MKSFIDGFIEKAPLTHALLGAVRQIGESRGRQELYKQQHRHVLKTLREMAVIQSTEASNRIEGVMASPERIKELIARKTTPRDRSEQEIAGYRDVLNTIHAAYDDVPFTTGVVLQLHRDLYQFVPGGGGRWKATDNSITELQADGSKRIRFEPVQAFVTPSYMETLHERFNVLWNGGRVDRLLLIPTYVLDFLCIHPFSDGNGRMGRLLTLLLLYKAGYEVGRYISLEQLVENSKESYYDALLKSSQGWHEGQHSLLPWWEYFLGVMLAKAYRDFELRVEAVSEGRGAKTELVLDTLGRLTGEFTARDIRDRCPTVSIDLVRRVLRLEQNAGRVKCMGRGPDAKWRRTQVTAS
jgi:Fic family protein